MTHTVSVTFYQGSGKEYTYEGIFPDRDAAINQAVEWMVGNADYNCRAWIDNMEIKPFEIRTLKGERIDCSEALYQALKPRTFGGGDAA